MPTTECTYALLKIQGPIADGPLSADTMLRSGQLITELPYSISQ